jgi:UDPglucose 6-dehydrogenase
MNIVVIGTGYVGLVTGTLFADRGNHVTCVDINEQIVANLNKGIVHIYEPGLAPLVFSAVQKGNLVFTTDLAKATKLAKVIFLAVGTPSNEDGSFNLSYLEGAARNVGMALKESEGFKVIVCKSTVPQGTWEHLSKIINQELQGNTKIRWAYVSNPETLAEGTAVRDFSKPDRTIIGTDSDEAFHIMQELYHPFNIEHERIIRGSPADAELAKLFANTALATRIAMVNEFARVADVTRGADMDIIRRMICEDKRIGYAFMYPSPGYGGSCFPKDVQGLVAKSSLHGYSPTILTMVHSSNETHKEYIASRVWFHLSSLQNAVVGVWGVTFKPKTDDMRDAASTPIINYLLEKGVRVKIYDPQDEKARKIFGDRVEFMETKMDAATGVDALILLTEWSDFDSPDYEELLKVMRGKYLFDLRNRWLPSVANSYGFNYVGIGRRYLL